MGHYCKICERTRANEKFSGKGNKKNVCKDCSKKPKQQGQNNPKENDLILGPKSLPEDKLTQMEDIYFNDIWFIGYELEEENTYIENDEDIPF